MDRGRRMGAQLNRMQYPPFLPSFPRSSHVAHTAYIQLRSYAATHGRVVLRRKHLSLVSLCDYSRPWPEAQQTGSHTHPHHVHRTTLWTTFSAGLPALPQRVHGRAAQAGQVQGHRRRLHARPPRRLGVGAQAVSLSHHPGPHHGPRCRGGRPQVRG